MILLITGAVLFLVVSLVTFRFLVNYLSLKNFSYSESVHCERWGKVVYGIRISSGSDLSIWFRTGSFMFNDFHHYMNAAKKDCNESNIELVSRAKYLIKEHQNIIKRSEEERVKLKNLLKTIDETTEKLKRM